MNKPNIFDHATKELTQDAFVCWLVSWAKPQYKSVNEKLHEIGKELIYALLGQSDLEPPERTVIESVSVMSQYKRIDILLLVNDNTWILIEDKTDTKDHGSQLKKYVDIIRAIDERDKRKRKLVCIYFKTGDQSDYSSLIGKDYSYRRFSRRDMLKALRRGNQLGVQHPFYVDYLGHLQEIQIETDSYRDIPMKLWHENSERTGSRMEDELLLIESKSRSRGHRRWIGFFMALQERFESSDSQVSVEWGYVPNQSGGFMGFWWRKVSGDRAPAYMQLEEDKLCFKIEPRTNDKEERRFDAETWADSLVKSFEGTEYRLKKTTIRGGKTMTVATLDDGQLSKSSCADYRVPRDNGKIDLQGTFDRLNRIVKLHTSAVKTYRPEN